jgi:hypothetical protein
MKLAMRRAGVSFDEAHLAPNEEEEEWVWVEGYKGTDLDMCCRDYQYELGKQFDMPEGENVELCRSGFHFCMVLSDVFKYYDVEKRNRFFKVKALVTRRIYRDIQWGSFKDKYVAKSIIFLEELPSSLVVNSAYPNCSSDGWTPEDMEAAREVGCGTVANRVKNRNLTSLGYSEAMAEYIIRRSRTDFAIALGKQPDISMDTRIRCLFNGN